jgi:hypothetical protein
MQNKISIMQICSDVSTHYHFCTMYTLKQYDQGPRNWGGGQLGHVPPHFF